MPYELEITKFTYEENIFCRYVRKFDDLKMKEKEIELKYLMNQKRWIRNCKLLEEKMTGTSIADSRNEIRNQKMDI